MPTPLQIQHAIQQVNDQQSLIQLLLRDTLGWEIPREVGEVEEIAYAWSAGDLHADGLDEKIVDGQVWQIQPLDADVAQPWGIFVLEFKHEDAFTAGRGLAGTLRKVLRGLVPKRRRQSNLPAWNRENLLFICTHQFQDFRFAYFKNPEGTKAAPLATFGWGPGTPARTACEFNLPSLVWPHDPGDSAAWLDMWRGAFDKDRLTKDFFSTFASLYYNVVEDIQATPELTEEAGRLAQLLLDRLLFLYFIQRKGWLNQEKDYLYSRFLRCDAEDPDGHSYYSTVLYPLFLRLSNSGFVAESVGDVPFLNGGLFEERCRQSQKQEVAHARLRIKNSTFRLLFSQLLERFNFTVTEDTPLDIEVAIDPEMLGRVFESLILQLERDPDKDLRRLTGSYYTPRSIVHFMCQQALKEYLAAQMAGEDQACIDSWRDKLGQVFDLNQAEHMSQEQLAVLEQLVTPVEAKLLSQTILNCRVCDPAVGSGAFLVGILHEMVAAKGRLDLLVHGRKALEAPNYYYDIKRRMIESCLYGVDVQEQAVRLCELRLWLSLVVDYEIDRSEPFAKTIRGIPSLPNLSYRIVRGDSLLERLFGHVVQLDVMAKDPKTRRLIESMQADKEAYFKASNSKEKHSVELRVLAKQADLAECLIEAKKGMAGVQADLWGKEAITERAQREKTKEEGRQREWIDLKQKVARAKAEIERLAVQEGDAHRGDLDLLRRQCFQTGDQPTFLWRVDFAEVFASNGGFDIIVANPPYLSFGLRGTKATATDWAHTVRRLYPGSAEYKISVYALFIDLALRLAAKDAVISYITPDSFLLGRYFSKLRRTVLDSAAIRTFVMFEHDFWKSGVIGRPTISVFQHGASPSSLTAILTMDEVALNAGNVKEHTYAQSYFETVPFNRFRLFFSPMAMGFVRAVENASQPLKTFARITTGVRSKSGQKNVVSLAKSGENWKRGIISGGQVHPFYVEWKGHYLHIDGELLFSGGWDASIVERPKIMIRQTGDTIIAAIDSECLYHLNNVHSLAPHEDSTSLVYLCALLNSRLMNRYYHLISLERRRAMAQTDIETLELLPVRYPDADIVKTIETLVTSTRSSSRCDEMEEVLEALYELPASCREYLRQEELYPDSAQQETSKGLK